MIIGIYSPRSRCYAFGVKRHGTPGSDRGGQAMIEYVIIAAMLISAVAVAAVLLYTFREHGGRVLDLVASEYP